MLIAFHALDDYLLHMSHMRDRLQKSDEDTHFVELGTQALLPSLYRTRTKEPGLYSNH